MSKYYITYTCGHPGVVDLGGPTKDRQSKADWMASFPCDACKAAEKEAANQAENQAAAQAAKEQGLPELEGSLKQIAYGETCRQKLLDKLTVATNNLRKNLERTDLNWPEEKRAAGAETLEQIQQAYVYVSQSKTKAAWWIEESREITEMRHIYPFVQRIMLEINRAEEQPAAPKQKDASEVVRPEHPLTETVATIRVAGSTVEIHFPEKRDDFREKVKSLGYTWNEGRWQRKIDFKAGKVEDRAAEAGHRLLAAGFIISGSDAAILANAVSGEYTAETTSWINTVRSDHAEYPDWFYITWSKADDYYQVARKIKGSRYLRPAVVVPPRHFEEVLDFADRHGFTFTLAAAQAITAAQAAREQELVIAVPQPTQHDPVKADPKPAQLEVHEGEIDEEFRDND